MTEDPEDMFLYMDEMIARLFPGPGREFITGIPRFSWYRIVIRDKAGFPHGPEPAGSVQEAREPVAEVHRIGNEVKVITGLPGITDDAVRLRVVGSRLVIDAGDGECHFHTSAEIPPVNTSSMRRSMKNGVLEVTFRAQAGPVKEGQENTGT